jgi:hypothetical protein
VTANDASRVYGDPEPTFSATITGLKAGDPPSTITGNPILTTDAVIGSDVADSPFTITPTIGDLNAGTNYTFTFVTALSPASWISPRQR